RFDGHLCLHLYHRCRWTVESKYAFECGTRERDSFSRHNTTSCASILRAPLVATRPGHSRMVGESISGYHRGVTRSSCRGSIVTVTSPRYVRPCFTNSEVRQPIPWRLL